MAVAFIIHFETTPETTESFAASLPEVARELAAVEGCEGVQAFRSESAPERFTLVERWTSKAHHEAHMEQVKASGRWQQVLDQLAAAPIAGYFDPLAPATE